MLEFFHCDSIFEFEERRIPQLQRGPQWTRHIHSLTIVHKILLIFNSYWIYLLVNNVSCSGCALISSTVLYTQSGFTNFVGTSVGTVRFLGAFLKMTKGTKIPKEHPIFTRPKLQCKARSIHAQYFHAAKLQLVNVSVKVEPFYNHAPNLFPEII